MRPLKVNRALANYAAGLMEHSEMIQASAGIAFMDTVLALDDSGKAVVRSGNIMVRDGADLAILAGHLFHECAKLPDWTARCMATTVTVANGLTLAGIDFVVIHGAAEYSPEPNLAYLLGEAPSVMSDSLTFHWCSAIKVGNASDANYVMVDPLSGLYTWVPVRSSDVRPSTPYGDLVVASAAGHRERERWMRHYFNLYGLNNPEIVTLTDTTLRERAIGCRFKEGR